MSPEDKRLLKLAAKAAGIELAERPFLHARGEAGALKSEGQVWNPLTDDGDALRLAVKLRLVVDIGEHEGEDSVCVFDGQAQSVSDERFYIKQPDSGDPLAATRRAIVRAAAAIGEAMPCPHSSTR